MKYTSTRSKNVLVTAQEAIVNGLAPDGGLYVPQAIPALSTEQLRAMVKMSYPNRAAYIMKMYLDDFTEAELLEFSEKAYCVESFPGGAAPVVNAGGDMYLELWHGPTCAFKDMALQMLPFLLTSSLRKTGQSEDALILTATSGDTGKAALSGFKDRENTRIMVFYPADGVSQIQKLQMATQEGENVSVFAVYGNFDDAQTGVKQIFSDGGVQAEILKNGCKFSSANSINWGRLLPQIVYYVSAYCDLVNAGVVELLDSLEISDKVNFCVPTGNFGNILAAYYAKCMGVPVGRLICASNENNILTDFVNTGSYDRRRNFHTTLSPSMDILISSNLERLLWHLCDEDAVKVSSFMASLSADGAYSVEDAVKAKISQLIWAGCCDDRETKAVIDNVWNEGDYLLDPHTAVAKSVKDKYFTETNDAIPTVIVSTASAYKFCSGVLDALGVKYDSDGVELIDLLQNITNIAPPPQLSELKNATVRFTDIVDKDEMKNCVLDFSK